MQGHAGIGDCSSLHLLVGQSSLVLPACADFQQVSSSYSGFAGVGCNRFQKGLGPSHLSLAGNFATVGTRERARLMLFS